jgi:hypothetical protein
VVLSVFGGLWWWAGSQTSSETAPVVARFGELRDCRWVDSAARVATGDAIVSGRRIELSAGSAELIFKTGARLQLVGPAIVEPRSENAVFLTLGEAHLVAETPQAKGFTITTPTSQFIDISTAFSATVSPDGLSRLEVSEGEVDVIVDGTRQRRRLERGQTLYVEPGTQKIITRIEPGDGTSAFRFSTIDPPSRDDFADQASGNATIRVGWGELRNVAGRGGAASVLLDGRGQSSQDSAEESAFFDSRMGGAFLVDLGQAISLERINCYSWHQHEKIETHRVRARQRFTLYGFEGDQLPDLKLSPEEAGWTRIARINTDQFFRVNEKLDRPAQQACQITSGGGEIGRFRYLLWEVQPHTFYGELDIFGAP